MSQDNVGGRDRNLAGVALLLRTMAKGAAVMLGGAYALSVAASSVVNFNETKKRYNGKPCDVCKAKGFYRCKLCKGKGTIDWSPLYDPVVINPCLCPTCDGNKVQKCLNCLGMGYT